MEGQADREKELPGAAQAPRIDISAQTGPNTGWAYPVHREEALSTDAVFAWNVVNAR